MGEFVVGFEGHGNANILRRRFPVGNQRAVERRGAKRGNVLCVYGPTRQKIVGHDNCRGHFSVGTSRSSSSNQLRMMSSCIGGDSGSGFTIKKRPSSDTS